MSNESRKILPTNGIAVVFALVGQPGKQSENCEELKLNHFRKNALCFVSKLKKVKEANKPISRSSTANCAKHILRKKQSQLFIRCVNGRTDQHQIICRLLAIFGLK